MKISLWVLSSVLACNAWANPYPDPQKVPVLDQEVLDRSRAQLTVKLGLSSQTGVIRITVDAGSSGESFSLAEIVRENSGTPALAKRSRQRPKWGSFVGVLESRDEIRDSRPPRIQRFDSIGTGHLFKFLNREISFRFPEADFLPVIQGGADPRLRFRLIAENSRSGKMEEVFRHEFRWPEATMIPPLFAPEIREIKPAAGDALQMVVYAEGYLAQDRKSFFADANRVPNVFETYRFPDWDKIRVLAAFFPSERKLPGAKNLGLPVPKLDTWLGLYFPYWLNFGRWYHVTYPTRERDFRRALASVPYDYPIALTHSSDYWGVGNYKSHTAIPAKNSRFAYLLMHEFGHFLGLNEEYDGGGRTELEFAPEIEEPWSQNLTFLREPKNLKWKKFVSSATPLPTDYSWWSGNGPRFGAYPGGYGDSEPIQRSYIPGRSCVMESGADFCPICLDAIHTMIRHDLGE